MIAQLLDFLRRPAIQRSRASSPAADDAGWKHSFEDALSRGESCRRTIVEYGRHGFPNHLRGWAWCQILHTAQVPGYLKDFDGEMLRIFGTVNPSHFQAPCFGSPLDIDHLRLSTAKKTVIKKLLCIVGNTHPHMEYAPIIPAIIAILCKFLEPDNVLACIIAMIEGHSIPAAKRQDWAYFPLYRRDYLVFERVFEELMRRFVPKIDRHVGKLQLRFSSFAPHWDRILSGIFVGILPREVVVRIFDCYLVEGYKTILRFAIAHVILRQEEILKTDTGDELNRCLVEPANFDEELLQRYFKTAFGIKFDRSIIDRYRTRCRKQSIGDFDAEDKLLIFQRPLPQLAKPSGFLQDEDWMALWQWVPARYRLLNLEMAFTTAEHGNFIHTLVSRCTDHEPILLLIETFSRKVFGAYLSKALTFVHGTSFYGTGETFLFALRPAPLHYPWNPKSDSNAFLCLTESFLALGAGDDFGLWIDRSLTKVASAPSITFDNQSLMDKTIEEDRRIYCLEAFRFV